MPFVPIGKTATTHNSGRQPRKPGRVLKAEAQAGTTVASRLTAKETAALAVIGITGSDAIAVADRMFRSVRKISLATATVGRPYYGRFGGGIWDDVLVRVTAREPIQEVIVTCHGGVALVESLLAQTADAGAPTVDWQRYMECRGESPLTVECRWALTQSKSATAVNILLDQLSGTLERGFEKAATDRLVIDEMLSWADLGRHVTVPWRVLLFGAPNVGKSSVLNALLGYERAIVSNLPGTTRDTLEGLALLGGWAVQLIDGAGLRSTQDELEAAGQRKILAAARDADLRIAVVDTSVAWHGDGLWPSLGSNLQADLVVGNKSDLATDWSDHALSQVHLRCSARTGDGIGELATTIERRLAPRLPEPGTPIPINQRQVDRLRELRASLDAHGAGNSA